MDVLDFIEKDAAKDSRLTLTGALILGGALALVSVGLGLGLREDQIGVLNLGHLLPNVLAALSLASIPAFHFLSRKIPAKAKRLVGMILLAAFFLSMWRAFSPWEATTQYASSIEFWTESKKCLLKGAVTAVVSSALLLFASTLLFSQLSRAWRFIFSVTIAASAAVMLTFHCDSSSLAHILAGHILPGLLVGAGLYGVQEFLFSRLIKTKFPELAARISNPRRLG